MNFLLDFDPIWSYVYVNPEGNQSFRFDPIQSYYAGRWSTECVIRCTVQRSVNRKQKRKTMKTHIIKDDGTVTVVEGKIEDLDAMQKLVKGPIEIVNASMPVASKELPGGKDLKEMVVNEEGLFNNSFQTNHKARKLIAQGLGVQLDSIQDIRGDVFVTDGWRIA